MSNNENLGKNEKENSVAQNSEIKEEDGKLDIPAVQPQSEPAAIFKNNNDEEVDKW